MRRLPLARTRGPISGSSGHQLRKRFGRDAQAQDIVQYSVQRVLHAFGEQGRRCRRGTAPRLALKVDFQQHRHALVDDTLAQAAWRHLFGHAFGVAAMKGQHVARR